MITIRESSVDEMLANANEMFEEHWQEVALNKHVMVLNPCVVKYQALEQAGKIMILSAWDDDELAGYSVCIIDNHLHYSDLVVCYNDLLFVSKKYRASKLGIRLIRETEQEGARRGAKLMLWHAKQDTALAVIMSRMKYKVQDIIFSKEI